MLRSPTNLLRTVSYATAASALAMPTLIAEGFRNPPAGAFSLARSGGRIAHVDDASAALQNPANVVDVDGVQLQPSATFVHVTVDYENGAGQTSETRDPLKVLPYFFATVPIIDDTLAAGFAFSVPFGLSNEWEKNGRFADPAGWRYVAPYYTEMMTVNANPSLSWRIHDRVAIGAGLNVYWSQLTFKQFFPLPGDPKVRIKGDGTAVGANAGITVNLTDRQRVAFTYRSPFTVEYEGDFRVGSAAQFVPGATPESRMTTEIQFPTILAAGYGIELTDTIRLETDIEWIQFSNFDHLDLDVGNNNFWVAPRSFQQHWKDTFTAGIAGDWAFAENWTARSSYQFYESPVPEFYFYPTIPDSNQHAFTTGLNYKHGNHAAEIAYAYIMYEDRNVRRNQIAAFTGKYEMVVHLWALSYNFSF